MADLNSILSSLGGIARQLAPAIVPGAGPLINGANAILSAINSVKEANGGHAPADAEAAHDALFDKVKAHAEDTLGRLEGRG